MNPRWKSYRKEFAHSYAFGVSAVLELLTARPEHALAVFVSSRGGRNSGIAQLRERCARQGLRVEVSDRILERLCPRSSHLAMGVFHKYCTRVDPVRDQIILVNPADMGNVGTIIRTMVGFGFGDLALIRPAVDVFDPKVVRASMGTLFRLSFDYYEGLRDCPAVRTHYLYPFVTNGQVTIDRVRFERPFALIFGNEGGGLPQPFRDLGTSVMIPQRGPVDSLNLSVAAAIALYEGARAGCR